MWDDSREFNRWRVEDLGGKSRGRKKGESSREDRKTRQQSIEAAVLDVLFPESWKPLRGLYLEVVG